MQTFVQFTISLFTLTNESYRHLIQPFFLNHTAKKTQSNRQRRFNTEQKRTNRKRRGFSEWISEIINI